LDVLDEMYLSPRDLEIGKRFTMERNVPFLLILERILVHPIIMQ
jgi:hypothetical protein